ncbi:MAG: hypothetical protein ACREMN_01115 [Gemmatimonadales bacterium]
MANTHIERQARGAAPSQKDPIERAAAQAHSTFETVRLNVTDTIDRVARAFERAGEQLGQEDQNGLAERVRQATGKAQSAARYLRDKSPLELKNDLDDFARRRPAWLLGGAFVAGLVGARFLKSSERARPASRLRDVAIKGEPDYATP